MTNIFFGRQNYLNILQKRIGDLKYGYRQNIAIIGDELVGKTSIIFKFLHKFYDCRIITLYLEARTESLAIFAKRFMGVLLYNFLTNSGIPLKEDLDYLLCQSEKYIPKTTEKMKLILAALEKKRKNNIFTELLSLCEIIHQESGKYCIVILDEFHNLESMEIKNLYREWSKSLILEKNTMYIIISSLKFHTKNILAKNLSLLFGNFELITVEPFDIKTSEEYLDSRIGNLNITKGFKDFIIHFTGGYPLYLELIAEALLKPNSASLSNILEDLLFNASGALNQRFSNYIKRFLDKPYSQEYISILYLIANGQNKIKELAHILHKPRGEFLNRIGYLLEIDTLTRSGDFLKINDRVFGYWLKFVYQERVQSLTFDAKNQKAKFIDSIEKMIREFILCAQKPICERLTELMRMFENETILIDSRRIKLTHFREIKPLEFKNRGLQNGLIGRSHDNLWIMAFKHDLLTEDDISDFALECKKYRQKPQKKIIISFKDTDSNAHLRALEEKILTWDLDHLNQIFDLFLKPRVIA
ncbi:hypothetical protein D4R78_04440 [bacterium]|nr:MAG: hypothetical protein D4R78_04440 [bacterium]